MWPSQDNLSSIDLIRDYAEKRDKKCAYVEIFRAYVARKLSIQAHFAYALTLKLTDNTLRPDSLFNSFTNG